MAILRKLARLNDLPRNCRNNMDLRWFWSIDMDSLLGNAVELDTRRKPEPAFVIRLVGPDMRPWAVPTRKLSRVLDAVQRLLDQSEYVEVLSGEPRTQDDNEAPGDGKTIRLLDVKKGSAAYPIAIGNVKPALKLIRDTGNGIENPAESDWTSPTLSALEELSGVAKSLGCQIEFVLPGDKSRRHGDVLATITPSTYHNVQQSAFVEGDTKIYATVERVGGATTMHCGVRLINQPSKMVICQVRQESLIRDLGQWIYQEVSLIGRATWLRRGYEVVGFVIESVEPPKTGSIMDALRRIHAAGGSGWDDVADPDAEIAELRG
ncbi:MAG: hypothetical protein KF838_11370 [Phycisphaeraceae bacterium]|nr:MAG: hypothetical protein KF838_11370 [Phycisphaeraceae bacterium]